MTLTIHDLNDWKRQEANAAVLIEPPADILTRLPVYLRKVKEEAGPHPAVWDPYCEAHAAMDVLQEIFRLRRAKLVRACETGAPPAPRLMFEFETCAWFSFLQTFQMFDKETEQVTIEGTWSGKWGVTKNGG